MFLTLAWAPWLIGILTVLFLIVCVVLILTILIQRPQGGGLSGAFGSGAGSGQTAFGAKTGDALTWFTIIVFVLFIGFAIVLNYAHSPEKLVAPAKAAVQQTSTDGKTPPADQNTPPAESAPAPDAPPADGKPAENKPAETAPAQPAPAEPKPEEKPATPPPAEPAPQPK